MQKMFAPTTVPSQEPILAMVFCYPGLPSAPKCQNNGELPALEKTSASWECKNKCCVDWGGPTGSHTACVSQAYVRKNYVILRNITKEVPIGELNCAA